jgi:subtilisin family serine protease
MMSTTVALSNAKIGATVHKDFSDDGLTGLQVVTLPSDLSVDEAIAEYKKNPDVLYAQPNYIYHLNAVTPDDTYYGSQWGLNNTIYPDADIAAPDAWGISTGSDSVVVAVVDTGVDYNHPDLAANIWANTDEIPSNGLDDDFNGYADDTRGWNFWDNTTDPMDGNYINNTYHGTHCAGTIGAVGNNNKGIAGVSWNAKIMPLRVANQYGDLYESDAILAINYAGANGADIISNSWGGYSNSQALKDAIDISPALVICAAGNDGVNNGTFIPASYDSANIISVAASTSTDQLAFFSNYGEIPVDLAAPGVNILSTNISISSSDTPLSYRYMHGTSAAAPFVAGTAALVKSVNRSLTAMEVKDIILTNVDELDSLAGKVNTSGRLNAYKPVMVTYVAGKTRIGLFRSPGVWIQDYNGNNAWDGNTWIGTSTDKMHGFGAIDDVPVFGDWNKNGIDEIGVFRSPGVWIQDYNGNNAWDGISTDKMYSFGAIDDIPLVGDWNQDGFKETGVFRSPGVWILDYNGNNAWDGTPTDKIIGFGATSDVPVVGDWNQDGFDEIGVFRSPGVWILDYNGNNAWDGTPTDRIYNYGATDDVPLVKDWNQDGFDEIGVFRSPGVWILDYNGNNAWDGTPTDKLYGFGDFGDIPAFGKWN